jgi:steroid 5-alpha reductase family enzyme
MPALAQIAIGLSLILAIAWVIQRLTRSSAWVDPIWSFGVGLGGVAAAILPGDHTVDGRRIVVGLLVAVWAVRLGLHIARRNLNADDPRYADLEKQWGKNAAIYMFFFLQIQAFAAWILVLAVRLAATNPQPFPTVQDIAGIALLILAIGGETLADAQLKQFGRTHKGEVCDIGLWKWSRHPNYFFEWLGWVAWAVIAANPANPWSFAALMAPAFMFYLLVFASGIPPLEKHMLATRGDRFRAYQARTSAFFPLPPRSPS